MIDTMEISQARRDLPKAVRGLKKSGSLAISNRGRTVAYLISRDRVEAMLETMEILGNPKAMKAIRDFEAGRTKFEPADVLNED
ncbi:MAG: type II toxin-antitoxin system Phd/YefM family antitoxin [Limisphaerales bacterium]